MAMNEEQLKEIKRICEQNGISYLGLFGSHARGEANEGSDVDLLVKYSTNSPIKGLISHLGVAQQFESFFKRPIDLIEEGIVKPRLQSYITKDLKTLYEG